MWIARHSGLAMQRGYLKNESSITNLCDFLKGEIKRSDMNQTEVAESIGLTQSGLSKKLSKGTLTVKELKGLALVLNIKKEEIAKRL